MLSLSFYVPPVKIFASRLRLNYFNNDTAKVLSLHPALQDILTRFSEAFRPKHTAMMLFLSQLMRTFSEAIRLQYNRIAVPKFRCTRRSWRLVRGFSASKYSVGVVSTPGDYDVLGGLSQAFQPKIQR